MTTNNLPSPNTCRQRARADTESSRDRALQNKVLPVITAGAVSGIARAVTSWLLDHVSL
ncbi:MULTISPECIES: hypothetical protein [unclassified Micromonospora]|uniref:hypothetical protein n=1 Tax=unclassified Micromonospora TaxID=2617518 RepID=UPI003645A7E6